jgi:hypothetical protein
VDENARAGFGFLQNGGYHSDETDAGGIRVRVGVRVRVRVRVRVIDPCLL